MQLKKSALTIIAALAFSQMTYAGDKYSLDLSGGKVDFHAVGRPKMLKIHGEGKDAKGSFTVDGGKVTGKATFDLSTLDTGIEMRNKHMKEKYLEVSKYPQAIFEFTDIQLPADMPANFDKEVPFKGKLTVHGVAQNVTGTAKMKRDGGTLTGSAEFSTTVKSHKIDLPSFAGVTMADEVKVQVEFTGPLKPAGRSVAKK